ncbi:mitogen-activated protein kinase kinase kinase 1-like [Phalaenopsis equestris]|uniref:mitogen-activated protein kinase kinase kinase 1-like n=1 Tax=Phalaenopsis equestris TaxID=78828 RepID=UPI0009E34BEE|nr:mitogen-activated protein kinase kinase kinase 1-like [Phalaenopsis equestris]
MFSLGSKKADRRREMTAAKSVRRPKLEQRNACKKINYEIPWASPSWRNSPALVTHCLDLSPGAYSDQTSFRIGGSVEGEIDLLCRSLGLSGPEDFAIPAAAWEASLKARSSCDLVLRSPFVKCESSSKPPQILPSVLDCLAETKAKVPGAETLRSSALVTSPATVSILSPPPGRSVLARPPLMKLPELDGTSSTWDIVRSFAPPDESDEGCKRKSFDSDEEKKVRVGVEVREAMDEMGAISGEISEDCTGSFSTSNDDDSSSTTTESMFLISPNGRIKRNIGSWMRGQLLGSGSFGTVYEGISDDGGFFAVKEVSLLEKGSSAQQCILQLEQEIALLSQFEHDNIVHYYGTDKEESKLFIFLELVTQGSLASLYHKYRLRNTQVSAYTRQILNGLRYLHERNVVHRDIKCANILVHANGSVKLADFGLAKEMSNLNDLKSCKGSVYWMAPEVVNPKKTYGYAADIWSLGCTVLEMLTRQIPYPNVEWQHAFFKIGRGDQPPIPCHLSKEAQDFITQCVQVDPNSRPTAAQLLEHPFIKIPIKI